MRSGATGALLAGPAEARTPRSLNVVDAGTPPPSAASHLRSAAALAQSRLLEEFNSQSIAVSNRLVASSAASTPSTTSGVPARFQN
eukprot:5381371-Lingulodinium_polyedra.AAC.1